MPAIFQRTFRVRNYECDAYGHLNNVNYVRYMQEAALDASAAVGWDVGRYQQIGHQWLIRETDIEYLLPLHYNEQVEVRTWVADFRRVQSRRMYEFRRPTDQQLVARATTNWVYLDNATLRPASIPAEMIAAFAPDGDVGQGKPDPFPQAPPPAPVVFQIRKRVEWRDIDTVGHVNNAAYFSYFEDVSTQVGRRFQWSMARMLQAGFAIVLRRLRVLYLQPALLDDEVDVACWLSGSKRATVTRHYTITRAADGAVLARGLGTLVCLDLQTMRPIRFPQALVDDFRDNMVTEP